jgi:diguanylate cyclase (GGDEF)-like protein
MNGPLPAPLHAQAAWTWLLEGLPHAAWVVDLATLRVAAANRAAMALLGETLPGQRGDTLLATPEDLAYWAEAAAGHAGPLLSDSVVCTADGRVLHVARSVRPLPHEPGHAPTHCVVMLWDRQAERQAEEQRDLLVAELQATLEATADGILVIGADGSLRAFNQRFAEIWALPEELRDSRDPRAVNDWMRRSVVDPQGYHARAETINEPSRLVTTERVELLSGRVLERVSRPLWRQGRPQGRVHSFRDLTERLAADERLEALALTDALTGLPNRRRLADHVAEASARASAEGRGFALLVIDLDRFRQINDSLGHETGDQVLIDIARRIQGCMRHQEVLARIGGDQFAVLAHEADIATAEASARRILNVVAQPCSVDGAPFTLTCSIGVALCPAHGQTIDELVRHAEAAMRAAKADGRANYRVHQTRGEVDLRQHMRLDHAMRQALVSGRFRLHYQPQVRLADGALVGAEALIRWRDPELGEVSPARFIPVAEDSGFIVAIGDWVLSQAVRQAALWHERGLAVPVAVNVSALQFRQPQFVDRVASVLAVSALPPQLLELELTESILVRDADEALQRLQALSRLGVGLAIDDFGTGYSSLAYLKRFPIGKLKIDRSFVQGLPEDESDAGIVRAVLQVALALGMKVVAEGVETELQRRFLVDNGCHEFQGFLYAPALDALSFEQRLAASRARPAGGPPHMRLVGT